MMDTSFTTPCVFEPPSGIFPHYADGDSSYYAGLQPTPDLGCLGGFPPAVGVVPAYVQPATTIPYAPPPTPTTPVTPRQYGYQYNQGTHFPESPALLVDVNDTSGFSKDPGTQAPRNSTSRVRVKYRNPPNQHATDLPVVYVSPGGLLTVLLRRNMAVEMTIDRTIRVVNHTHKAVVATNGRGNASCIYHSAAKIFQQLTSTDAALFWDRKVKMNTEHIRFAAGQQCYHMSPLGLSIEDTTFPDLSQDMSVNLLYSSSGYGPSLIPAFSEVAKEAKYIYHKRGGVTVHINGMRIFQNSRGDVMVSSGPKYIRASPLTGNVYLQTHFVEMAVESNWRVRIKRGEQRVLACFQNFFVSDGFCEAGFDPMGHILYQPVIVVTETIIDKTKSDLCSAKGNGAHTVVVDTRRTQSEACMTGHTGVGYGYSSMGPHGGHQRPMMYASAHTLPQEPCGMYPVINMPLPVQVYPSLSQEGVVASLSSGFVNSPHVTHIPLSVNRRSIEQVPHSPFVLAQSQFLNTDVTDHMVNKVPADADHTPDDQTSTGTLVTSIPETVDGFVWITADEVKLSKEHVEAGEKRSERQSEQHGLQGGKQSSVHQTEGHLHRPERIVEEEERKGKRVTHDGKKGWEPMELQCQMTVDANSEDIPDVTVAQTTESAVQQKLLVSSPHPTNHKPRIEDTHGLTPHNATDDTVNEEFALTCNRCRSESSCDIHPLTPTCKVHQGRTGSWSTSETISSNSYDGTCQEIGGDVHKVKTGSPPCKNPPNATIKHLNTSDETSGETTIAATSTNCHFPGDLAISSVCDASYNDSDSRDASHDTPSVSAMSANNSGTSASLSHTNDVSSDVDACGPESNICNASANVMQGYSTDENCDNPLIVTDKSSKSSLCDTSEMTDISTDGRQDSDSEFYASAAEELLQENNVLSTDHSRSTDIGTSRTIE